MRVAKGEKFQPCNRPQRAIDKLHLLQRTKQHAKEAEEEKELTNERTKEKVVCNKRVWARVSQWATEEVEGGGKD